MHQLTKTIQESLEGFDEKFTHKDAWGGEELHFLNEGSPEAVKAHLLQSQINLVEKIIEMLDDDLKSEEAAQADSVITDTLDYHIDSLTQVLNELKNV